MKILKDFFGVLGESWSGFLVMKRQSGSYGRAWPFWLPQEMIESCDVEVVCETWSLALVRTWSLFEQFWIWVDVLVRIQNCCFLQEKGLFLCLMNPICFVWEGPSGQVLWVQERNQNHFEPWVLLLAYLSLQMSQTYCAEEKVETCCQPLEMIQSDFSV